MNLFGKNPEKTGSMDFPTEGYCVKWDQSGLQIEATDYHAGTLNLPWAYIMKLAEQYSPKKNSVFPGKKKKKKK